MTIFFSPGQMNAFYRRHKKTNYVHIFSEKFVESSVPKMGHVLWLTYHSRIMKDILKIQFLDLIRGGEVGENGQKWVFMFLVFIIRKNYQLKYCIFFCVFR